MKHINLTILLIATSGHLSAVIKTASYKIRGSNRDFTFQYDTEGGKNIQAINNSGKDIAIWGIPFNTPPVMIARMNKSTTTPVSLTFPSNLRVIYAIEAHIFNNPNIKQIVSQGPEPFENWIKTQENKYWGSHGIEIDTYKQSSGSLQEYYNKYMLADAYKNRGKKLIVSSDRMTGVKYPGRPRIKWEQ